MIALVTGAAGFVGSHLCAALLDSSSSVYGDGEQTRDCTYVGDVVQAMRDAADTSVAAAAFGYRPRTSLPEGLAAMVAWARSPEHAMT